MKRLTHALLGLLLALAPVQAGYAHSCHGPGTAAPAVTEIVQQAGADDSRDVVPFGETCEQNECGCVYGVSCLHHCSTTTSALSTIWDEPSFELGVGVWRPAAFRFYLDFILPTDTRPPQIPA